MQNKTYKLIKEFPNSEALGTVVSKVENTCLYLSSHNKSYSIKAIESFPEFWQSVTKYETISYRFLKDIGFNLAGTIINASKGSCYSRGNFEKSLGVDYEIYGLRNNITNDIFTIGQRVLVKSNSAIIKIESFLYKDENYFLNESYDIDEVVKLLPIFTTKDGVEICEGDNYYQVDYKRNSWCIKAKGSTTAYLNKPDAKYFKHRAKARTWITKNKPVISLQEVIDIKKEHDCLGDSLIKLLEDLVNNKFKEEK